MEHYWIIEKWDGELIEVQPSAVPAVRRAIAQNEGYIHATTRDIAVKDVRDFRETSKAYSDQKLIEGASQAFGEPLINADGSIAARWVKKAVPRREWAKHYKFHTSYYALVEEENYMWIAFLLPVHMQKGPNTYACDPMEVNKLENWRRAG